MNKVSIRIPTRVAQIVEPRKIEIVENILELGPHDVAVKIAACGICSWESGFYSGQRPTDLPGRSVTNRRESSRPWDPK